MDTSLSQEDRENDHDDLESQVFEAIKATLASLQRSPCANTPNDRRVDFLNSPIVLYRLGLRDKDSVGPISTYFSDK